ncbi:MAG: DUF262 domain-containing protein [Coriobacteriia bacterium]|nr:DUF262 domain-containing protein [Coriobacteriia bacterium]
MKTELATYLDFLGTPKTQMCIPVFQRIYTWGAWQCEELWGDILKAGASGDEHFIGTVVYTVEEACAEDSVRGVEGLSFDEPAEGESAGSVSSPDPAAAAGVDWLYNIVDGQQRTTTIFLLFIALRDYLRASGKTAAGIEREFLYLPSDEGRTQKFIAAPADKNTLAAIMGNADMPEEYLVSQCVVDNFAFFQEKLPDADLDQVWRGLQRLYAIAIKLESDDNPQFIFESINSKGMNLATIDLLRNRMFFEQDPQTQERLLEEYWMPLETLFENDPNQVKFSAALRYWLVCKDRTAKKYSRFEIYSVFRKYVEAHYPPERTEELMSDLLASCKRFKAMLKGPQMKQHLEWADDSQKIDTGTGAALFG